MNTLSSAILLATTLLPACSSSNPPGEQSRADFCVPEVFAVAAPFGKGTSVGGDFDTDDNPFDARLLIPAERVAHEVDGYSPVVKVRTSQLRQSLYIIIDRVRHYSLPANSSVEPFKGYENLQKLVTNDPFSWDVLELSDEGSQRWGDCSDDYSGSFECWRVLQFEEFQVTYKIRPENIHLYRKLDGFVTATITNCDNVRK